MVSALGAKKEEVHLREVELEKKLKELQPEAAAAPEQLSPKPKKGLMSMAMGAKSLAAKGAAKAADLASQGVSAAATSPPAVDVVEATFAEPGPIGFSFNGDSTATHVISVKDASHAARAGNVPVGSTLLSIATGGAVQNVEGMAYADVLTILKQGVRPVTMSFRLPPADPDPPPPPPPADDASPPPAGDELRTAEAAQGTAEVPVPAAVSPEEQPEETPPPPAAVEPPRPARPAKAAEGSASDVTQSAAASHAATADFLQDDDELSPAPPPTLEPNPEPELKTEPEQVEAPPEVRSARTQQNATICLTDLSATSLLACPSRR